MSHIDKLLLKLRESGCSGEELKELEKVISGERNSDELMAFLETEIKEADIKGVSDSISNEIWNNLLLRLRNRNGMNRKRRLYNLIGKVAAIVSIVLLAGVILSRSREADIITVSTLDNNSTRFVVLPDSSKVWINTNSKISYPKKFHKERTVVLEGQAYFEVEKYQGKRFVVESENFRAIVLGTCFDMEAYKESGVVTVSLLEGKVSVQKVSSGKKDINWTLSPMQMFSYKEKTGDISISTFNKDYISSWRGNEFRFFETSLEDVIRVVTNYHTGWTIEISSENISKSKITGTFNRMDNVENILESICFSKDLKLISSGEKKYRIEDN